MICDQIWEYNYPRQGPAMLSEAEHEEIGHASSDQSVHTAVAEWVVNEKETGYHSVQMPGCDCGDTPEEYCHRDTSKKGECKAQRRQSQSCPLSEINLPCLRRQEMIIVYCLYYHFPYLLIGEIANYGRETEPMRRSI